VPVFAGASRHGKWNPYACCRLLGLGACACFVLAVYGISLLIAAAAAAGPATIEPAEAMVVLIDACVHAPCLQS